MGCANGTSELGVSPRPSTVFCMRTNPLGTSSGDEACCLEPCPRFALLWLGRGGGWGVCLGEGKGKERAEGGGLSLGSKIDRVADDLRLVATEEADDLSMDDSRLNGSGGFNDR